MPLGRWLVFVRISLVIKRPVATSDSLKTRRTVWTSLSITMRWRPLDRPTTSPYSAFHFSNVSSGLLPKESALPRKGRPATQEQTDCKSFTYLQHWRQFSYNTIAMTAIYLKTLWLINNQASSERHGKYFKLLKTCYFVLSMNKIKAPRGPGGKPFGRREYSQRNDRIKAATAAAIDNSMF